MGVPPQPEEAWRHRRDSQATPAILRTKRHTGPILTQQVKFRRCRLLYRITVGNSTMTFMTEMTLWCRSVKSAVLGEAVSGMRPRRCSRLTFSKSPTWSMNEPMLDLASRTQDIAGMVNAADVRRTSQLHEKAGPKIAQCYRETSKESFLALSKAESVSTLIPSQFVPRSEEEKNCGFVT